MSTSNKRGSAELHALHVLYKENETHLDKCRKLGKEIHKLQRRLSMIEFSREQHSRERAFRAVHKNVPETIRRLLGEGLDPDIATDTGWTLLGIALSKGDSCVEMVQLLLDNGAVSGNGIIDLLFLAPAGNPLVQALIVEASTNLNVRNILTDDTPLIYAAKNKDLFMHDLLLKKGADPKMLDSSGRTAASYL